MTKPNKTSTSIDRLDEHLREHPLPKFRRAAVERTPRLAILARDAGHRRVRALTRSLAAGAIALSGGLAFTAANSFHGHASSSPQTPTNLPVSNNGVQAPVQPPTTTPAPAVVVSGGS